jgi:co-chaperonin GroES (HSP10)
MKLSVLNDRVFVRPDAMPEMTSDGLLHLVHDRQASTMTGEVVAIGDGPLTPSGKRYGHVVKVGDRVVFSPDAGNELIFERDLLISMKETDLLAVLD